jgi:hypothetical protein
MKHTTRLKGYIRTSSGLTTANNPLQSRVEIILTDFEPNLNKQGVPVTEKQRLLTSALNMPLKIDFDGTDFYGHVGAIPLGPIIRVWEDTYNGREVIKGEAVIWTEYYKDIAEHLKALFDIGVGTSWEIYYADSSVDANGVEWLQDIVYAGTCIVETPAYGPERTRVLAIAEKLGERHMEGEIESSGELDTTVNPIIAEKETAAETEDTTVREDISQAQELLIRIYEGLESLYVTTYEIEREQTEANIGTIAENFASLIDQIATKIAAMRSSMSSLSEELTTLKTAEATRVAEAAKTALAQTRKNRLVTAGIFNAERWAVRKDVILTMSNEDFDAYVEDLSSFVLSGVKSQAEITNPVIPEPVGSSDDTVTAEELGIVLKKALKGNK